MPSVTLYPSEVDTSNSQYYQISSNYPATAIVGKGTNNSGYGVGVNLTRNANSVTNLYIDFDVSSIPEEAIIESVTCDVAIYGSATFQSRTTTRTIQLCKNTTAVGNATDWDVSGTTDTPSITNSGSWTRSDLNNIKLLVQVVRNSSNTTSNTYMYIRGADLNITYTEDDGIRYTVTLSADGVITDKTGETIVKNKASFDVKIEGNIVTATDNGVNILDKITAHQLNTSSSITGNPTEASTSGSIRGTYYKNAIGNGSSNTVSGNDYCQSSGSTATIIYSFDFSNIPSNAIIDSVEVIVGGHLESTSNSSEVADLQLYSGDTQKGDKSSFSSTSKELVNMNAGTWTRSELQDAKLHFIIGYYGGQVNGVDFIVNYSIPSDEIDYYTYSLQNITSDHIIKFSNRKSGTRLRIKVNNTYKQVLKIYQKVNGSYVEITDDSLSSDMNFVYIE